MPLFRTSPMPISLIEDAFHICNMLGHVRSIQYAFYLLHASMFSYKRILD